jgi:hypothetical protein
MKSLNLSPKDEDMQMNLEDFEMQDGDVNLEDEIHTLHDKLNKYQELENFLCGISDGAAFGELSMLNPKSNIYLSERNYSTICISDQCLMVQILRSDLDRLLLSKCKKAIDLKRDFISSTECFRDKIG